MSLHQVIVHLKNNHLYEEIPRFFEQRRAECIADLMNKAPNIKQSDIDKANNEMAVYESLMNLDKWADIEQKKENLEREGGLERLGKLIRFRKR